jgi:hypothetical protein
MVAAQRDVPSRAESMFRIRKRNVMIAIAISAVAAGATVAGLQAGRRAHHGPARRPGTHARRDNAALNRPDTLARVAAYLGVSRARLHSELQSGHTLAQIADATSGRSATGLIDALLSTRERQLRVGPRTAANAASPEMQRARLARLRAHVSAQVYGSAPRARRRRASRRAAG